MFSVVSVLLFTGWGGGGGDPWRGWLVYSLYPPTPKGPGRKDQWKDWSVKSASLPCPDQVWFA